MTFCEEKFKIEKKIIGNGNPTFLIGFPQIITEKNTTKKLINYAAESGFDAVKFQIYDAAELFLKMK